MLPFTPYVFSLLIYYLVLSELDTVHGWGTVGHEVIGEIAWSRLSAYAQLAVKDILHSSDSCYPRRNSSLLPSPLAQVSTWADYIRYVPGYDWTTPLHYINVQEKSYQDKCKAFSDDCKFVYVRDCVHDYCVAGAIPNYTQQINGMTRTLEQSHVSVTKVRKTRNISRREILNRKKIPSCNLDAEALMFVTHFVGDIHQPLHVSRQGDYGGNSIHVYFPTREVLERQPGYIYTNLHKVWDEDIIYRVLKDAFEHSEEKFYEAVQQYIKENVAEIDSWLVCGNAEDIGCTSSWAEESLDLALSVAYADPKTGYDIEKGSELPEEYYYLGLIVITRRLAQAGVRLAYILESVLGTASLADRPYSFA